MTEGLVKQSIAELRDFARCRRYMVDAVQVVADRIEELEARLAEAVEALEHLVYLQSGNPCTGIQAGKWLDDARTTIAELKEETHE